MHEENKEKVENDKKERKNVERREENGNAEYLFMYIPYRTVLSTFIYQKEKVEKLFGNVDVKQCVIIIFHFHFLITLLCVKNKKKSYIKRSQFE